MKVKNPDGTITLADGTTYDPTKQFVKRRGGRNLVFDKQIQTWRRRYKAKGCLKDSKMPTHNRVWLQKQVMKQFGNGP